MSMTAMIRPTVALLGALVACAPTIARAYPTGITGYARPGLGCTCHGLAQTANTTTQLFIMGLPDDGYAPDTAYKLTVLVLGTAVPAPLFAGFDLEATAGTLRSLDGSSYVSSFDGEATHSTPKRPGMWDVEWTSPPAGTGPVTFYVAGNVVNGIGIQTNADPGDIWSVKNPPFVVPQH